MTSAGTRRLVLALSIHVLLMPVAVAAQTATPEEPPANEEVRALLTEAVMEYSAQHYAEAQALFQRAHALRPGARTLRGIGMTAFELRHYVDSVFNLQASLDEPANPLSEEQRLQVEALLARALRFVGRFRLQLSPVEATLTVDGRTPRIQVDGSVLLELGTHTIAGRCEGCVPRSLRVIVAGGEDETLELTLEHATPAPLAPEPEPEPEPVTTAPASDLNDASEGPAALSWGVLGMGGAMLAGSVATGVFALQAKGDLDDGCMTTTMCPESLRGTRDSARRLSIVTDILWVTGGAFVLAGVLWRIFGGDDEERVPAVAVCGPHGCNITVRGSL